MRIFVSIVLLLVQLGPIAGAGLCLHDSPKAAQPDTGCTMPMDGTPQGGQQTHPGSSPDCAQLVICAPAAPGVPPLAVQLFGVFQASHTAFSTPTSLLPGDPIAPPEPPPIA